MFSRMLKKMERVILSKEPSKWLKMIDQILTRSYFSCFSTLTFQTWYLSRQSSLNYGKELRKSLFIVGEFYSFMSDFYLSAKAVTYNCDRLRDRLLQQRSMFISWLDINISNNSCSQTHIKHKMADITHTRWDFLDFTQAENESDK